MWLDFLVLNYAREQPLHLIEYDPGSIQPTFARGA
jgi:hypothetical protein